MEPSLTPEQQATLDRDFPPATADPAAREAAAAKLAASPPSPTAAAAPAPVNPPPHVNPEGAHPDAATLTIADDHPSGTLSGSATNSGGASDDLKKAETDTIAKAKAEAKTVVDSAIDLLENFLKSVEDDAEGLVPEYEQGAITTALSYLPESVSGLLSGFVGMATLALAVVNTQLDTTARAYVAIAISDLEGVRSRLGG